MATASIRPSTLGGIKQLAKKIRRERNISHSEALELASRQAGYENLVHAKRRLPVHGAPTSFPVYLTVHWQDWPERNGEATSSPPCYRAGRETLRVDLARPLCQVVTKHRVSRARGLSGFRMEYADHLEHLTNIQGQDRARDVLVSAARSLHFMEATGLQPVSTNRYASLQSTMTHLPGNDHLSHWFDPATAVYVCLDEPYRPAVMGLIPGRQRWLEQTGLQMVTPEWEGIYNAGHCVPHLISSDTALLQRVTAAVAKAQPLPSPTTWPHETGLCGEDFVSPQRLADAKPRRPRPRPSWRNHKGASPYGGAAGIPSKWRPAKPMQLELHRELGHLLQQLVGFSWRVTQKLGTARSRLDEWSVLEHKHLNNEVASDLYYGGRNIRFCTTDAERLDGLSKARALVGRGYDECKPRREILAIFDAAIGEVHKRQNL